MKNYKNPLKSNWTGRTSNANLYLHEKVNCISIGELQKTAATFSILGYACDEGVKRNKGRIGAKNAPEAIRKALGKMPNHLKEKQRLLDLGDIICVDDKLEEAQENLSDAVAYLLKNNTLPILLGGGHDIAYVHYNGIKKHFANLNKKVKIGIINFDAHLDLRKDTYGANSGTPFFQIAKENTHFNYLCLGVRKDANDKSLFKTAKELGVNLVYNTNFSIEFAEEINTQLTAFINNVDYVYVTIDLDGFSSAYAPGVSAPSPMGFSPAIVLRCLETIIASKKLISLDIAEMNPKYDIDNQTAKLAASLIHHIIHLI